VAPIDERRSRLPPIQYEDYEDYRSEDCTVIGSALMVLGDNYGANEYVNLLKNIPCADTEVVVPREMRSLPPDFHQHRRIEDAHSDPNTLVLLACSVDETPHNLRRALVHGFRRIAIVSDPSLFSDELLEKMQDDATKWGVTVFFPTLWKTASRYVAAARTFERGLLSYENAVITFEGGDNDVMVAQGTSMLRGRAFHDLVLLVAYATVSERSILHAVVNPQASEVEEVNGVKTFSRLAFSVTTTHGLVSHVHVGRFGENGNAAVAISQGDEVYRSHDTLGPFNEMRRIYEAMVNPEEYLPDGIASLALVIEARRVADYLEPILLAQLPLGDDPQKTNLHRVETDEDSISNAYAQHASQAPSWARRGPVSHEDPLIAYYRTIAQYPLLTEHGEIMLAQQIQAGNRVRENFPTLRPRSHLNIRQVLRSAEEAEEMFVRSNLRLVVWMAKKYNRYPTTGPTLPLFDMIQEGNIGLMKAVQKFDWSKGVRFSSYAQYWIKLYIDRSLQNTGRTIRLPVRAEVQLTQIKRTLMLMQEQLGRRPTFSEVATAVGLSQDRVELLLSADPGPRSLDEPLIPNSDFALADLIPACGPEIDPTTQILATEQLRAMLRPLSETAQKVIELRFGLTYDGPMTRSEVAEHLQLSRQKVSYYEREALVRLKRMNHIERFPEELFA
jgi:RNA polymerase primary sigma factor